MESLTRVKEIEFTNGKVVLKECFINRSYINTVREVAIDTETRKSLNLTEDIRFLEVIILNRSLTVIDENQFVKCKTTFKGLIYGTTQEIR